MTFEQWYQTKVGKIEEILFEEGEINTSITMLIESTALEAWNKGYETHFNEITYAMEELGIIAEEEEDDCFGYEYYR